MPSKNRLKIILILVILLALIGYVVWDVACTGPLTMLFTDRDRLVAIVESMGVFGPLLFMLLQLVQAIIAPIPSNVIGTIGGFLFGWWGVLWTTISATLGAFIVFYLSRRFGRRLVEHFVKPETLKRFDFIFESDRATIVLFLIFLIPGLPDDIVCYVAGLTKVPLRHLVMIFAIGRLPAVIVNNYVGMGLGEGNITLVFWVVAAAVLIFAVAYWQQDRILGLLRKGKKSSKAKKS